MTKILNILVNEDPNQMNLGMNSTLLYALCASTLLGFEVNFFRIDENHGFPENIKSFYRVDREMAKILFTEYQKQNQLIRDSAKQEKKQIASHVGDFLYANKLNKFLNIITDSASINEALRGLVLNRVEPMKSPFPPDGNVDINIFLQNLINQFNYIHAPINLHDKEFIPNLSTPTFEIKTSDLKSLSNNLGKIIYNAISLYKEFYTDKHNSRIVIKPRDSAQSMGVCAIEFGENHKINSFNQINEKSQIYKINKSVLIDNNLLTNIIKRILDNQCPRGKTIFDIYNNIILIQPYLEGVSIGDFRSIIIKNLESNFEYCGSVFRKRVNNKSNLDNFTTCATAGQSIPSKCGVFQDSIDKFSEKIVNYLNNNKEKYRKVHAIGVDIIAKENVHESQFFLGEMNMHCPALISMIGINLSEVIDKIIIPQIELLNFYKQNL